MSEDRAFRPEIQVALRSMQTYLEGAGYRLQPIPVDYGARLEIGTGSEPNAVGHLYYSPRKDRFTLHLPPGMQPEAAEALRRSVEGLSARIIQEQESHPRKEAPLSGQRVIDDHLTRALPALHTAGIFAHTMEPIPYGLKLVLARGEETVSAQIYHSRKKGLSVRLGPSRSAELARVVEEILRPVVEPGGSREERSLQTWVGTDEAGKGDYLGPLVAAAVQVDRMELSQPELRRSVDSKRLPDRQLIQLARDLRERLGRRFAVVEIGPARYNELYTEYERRGSKLNGLLAWAHGRAVRDLLERGLSFQAVVIDRFARPEVIRRGLPEEVRCITRPRAEDNPAVAAASILARAAYLERLEKLSRELDVRLVPGAGGPADRAACELVRSAGEQVLQRVAKLHFKNTARILRSVSQK